MPIAIENTRKGVQPQQAFSLIGERKQMHMPQKHTHTHTRQEKAVSWIFWQRIKIVQEGFIQKEWLVLSCRCWWGLVRWKGRGMLCVARRHVQRHGGKMDDDQSMFSGSQDKPWLGKRLCVFWHVWHKLDTRDTSPHPPAPSKHYSSAPALSLLSIQRSQNPVYWSCPQR